MSQANFQLDIHAGGSTHPSPRHMGDAGEGVDYGPTILSTCYSLDRYPPRNDHTVLQQQVTQKFQ